MVWKRNLPRAYQRCTALISIALVCFCLQFSWARGMKVESSGQRLFLPLVMGPPPMRSSFYGQETGLGRLLDPRTIKYASQLGGKWIRLNAVSWRNVQPVEGGEYNWAALAKFDTQLAAAVRAGLTPIVIVRDSPEWATGTPKTCAPILKQHIAAFAKFMHALALRYNEETPYPIDYWEIGNEPDVDPSLVGVGSPGGCWGDINDPYYGGGRYGDMLKVVTPAIKSANPDARVLIGGLLLWTPLTTEAWKGKPERFFEGILRSGAQDYFDFVAYHDYLAYSGKPEDPIVNYKEWAEFGGMGIGKPTYLRRIMARYNVSKPLILNETAVICNSVSPTGLCTNATPDVIQTFLEVQADTLAPLLVRALGVNVETVMWYTLSGGSWNYCDLLDSRQNPRPAYLAYQTLVEQTGSALQHPSRIQDYGANVEAYRFVFDDHLVDVVWSPDRTAQVLRMPENDFVAAYNRDGNKLSPTSQGNSVEFVTGGSVLYIHRSLSSH